MPSPKKTAKCGITRNHRYLNNMTKNNPTNILLLLPIHKVEYATFLHCKFILFQPYVWGVIRGCWYILFLIVLKNCANKKQKYCFCPNFAGPPPLPLPVKKLCQQKTKVSLLSKLCWTPPYQ